MCLNETYVFFIHKVKLCGHGLVWMVIRHKRLRCMNNKMITNAVSYFENNDVYESSSQKGQGCNAKVFAIGGIAVWNLYLNWKLFNLLLWPGSCPMCMSDCTLVSTLHIVIIFCELGRQITEIFMRTNARTHNHMVESIDLYRLCTVCSALLTHRLHMYLCVCVCVSRQFKGIRV